MLARFSAFVVWALVAAIAVFWTLRLTARSPEVPAHAVAVGQASATHADLTRLFGVTPAANTATAAPEAAARFHLLGIIAPRPHGASPNASGVALIAVDGNLPRAFSVGSAVDDDLVLQSVSLRTASIGPAQGARSLLLELPALPPPATGALPVVNGIAMALRPASPVVAPKAVMPVPMAGAPLAPPAVAVPPPSADAEQLQREAAARRQ